MKNRNIYIIAAMVQIVAPVWGVAQTVLSVTQNGNQPPKINVQVDNVTLDNRTSMMSAPGNNKSPRKVVWIEYGDGQFTTSPETEHFFYRNTKTTFPFMLVKATGIYDQGGKPPKHSTKPVSSLLGDKMSPGNIVFDNTNEDVRITPNVFDVMAGDTMMVALTYRKPANAPRGLYRLLFFYNSKGIIFEPINPDGRYPLRNEEGQRIAVPYVRTHNGELAVAPDRLPQPAYEQYRDRFRSSGYLVFNIELNDDNEHHIFLTMVPRHDLKGGENYKADMDAILLPPDNSPPKAFNHSSRLLGSLASHDPNWQEVFPKCIVLPKANQEMKHHVHFQNTGAGPAKRVKVKTAYPTGLAGNDITVTGWAIGGVRNNPNYQLNIDRSSADSIVFEFIYNPANTGKVLYGAAELPDAPVNAKTMGDIYFTCKAKPGTPNTMNSGTSIYFDDNEAVKTEEAKVEFKKCCDCDKDCRQKSKFMKWLLCKEC